MSEEKQKGVTLKQGFSYMKRGLGIIRKLFPWYLTLSSLSSVLSAVRPLLMLYFSARILDELSGARNLRTIAAYAVLAVGMNFIFSFLNSVISRKTKVINSTFWFR